MCFVFRSNQPCKPAQPMQLNRCCYTSFQLNFGFIFRDTAQNTIGVVVVVIVVLVVSKELTQAADSVFHCGVDFPVQWSHPFHRFNRQQPILVDHTLPQLWRDCLGLFLLATQTTICSSSQSRSVTHFNGQQLAVSIGIAVLLHRLGFEKATTCCCAPIFQDGG